MKRENRLHETKEDPEKEKKRKRRECYQELNGSGGEEWNWMKKEQTKWGCGYCEKMRENVKMGGVVNGIESES